jgi:hypothetical protein
LSLKLWNAAVRHDAAVQMVVKGRSEDYAINEAEQLMPNGSKLKYPGKWSQTSPSFSMSGFCFILRIPNRPAMLELEPNTAAPEIDHLPDSLAAP